MNPPPSPRRRGVRNYFRDQFDKLVRSHSRSPSAEASSSGAYPTSPPPQSAGRSLAPPTAEEAAALRHSQSASYLAPTPKPPAARSRNIDSTWGGLQVALEALHRGASMFPPIQQAVDALISCLDVLEMVSKNRREYEDIALELKTLSQSLAQHMNDSNSAGMSNCIANAAICIEQQAKLINAKCNRGAGSRLLTAVTDEEEVIQHYRRIGALFRQLQTDASLSTWSIANEHLVNTRLESLAPAKLASYDSTLSTEIHRRTCTEGTRTAVLSGMDKWSNDPDAPELYWMDGMAGTGKTTIACSFSKKLEERKQLAASFFCTRSSPECRQVSRIIPTIAYQLARYSISFQCALCQVLGNEPDIGTKNVAKQVERLLKEPLHQVRKMIPNNLVVVIDALDECEDRHGVKLVLDLLFKFAPDLPLKFFVTSRPEPEIYEKMIIQSQSSREVIHLHEIEKSLVEADIELYLREELSFMKPTVDEVNQLVGRSGNLFIYAATLVRYIRPAKRSVDPQRRLWSVLEITSDSTSRYAEVDALYMAVLRSVLEEEGLDAGESEDVRLVLQTVLCSQEPVSVETLTALTGMKTNRRTLSALQLLRSVLHFSDTNGLVSIFHASFPDFMFDKERSSLFFCDVGKHNAVLARKCFEVMEAQLRFNICKLESSFIPDSMVASLDHRIKQHISPTLSYACRYWGDHLRLAGYSMANEICTALEEFLAVRLLFWMEVLNLKRETGVGIQILVMAKIWLQAGNSSLDLVRFVDDAQSFVTSYAANPVSESTPHIYVSSLPLCPRSSTVFQHYQKRTRDMVELTGGGMEQRETAALASWAIGAPIRSVSYSSDGTRVAFGCDDGTVGVRNAYDGTSIVAPFKPHNDKVLSVCFSPDSTRVVSGAQDSTVRLWNAHDGSLVNVSFTGHSGGINAVAFSPDGLLIVAGAADHTTRIWRAADGSPVGGPLEGHTRWVRSVGFSPDGKRIVSGSGDNVIRIWNIDDGVLVFDPIKGHTGVIYSVAYSPDGKHIASGSADKTVRVWHAQTGASAVKPMEGHIAEVNSVAFSPDSTRIVSGSSDFTIRVWSLHKGTLIAGPFGGHIDMVLSVSFSPDGMRVVSGSYDRTIRVWNIRDDLPVARQFEGHTNGIWSVAFSPDGASIASGSSDRTLRAWSAKDGAPIVGPFEGHTERIWSVAFSPDGGRIISSSADRSIRVWNTQNGTSASGPLKGHTEAVNAVAYSSDGVHIASGSRDRCVRIWDLVNSKLVAGPLKGHSDVVISVAFSPDGTRLVSGSYDSTLRIWSAPKGDLVAGPFREHAGWVMSVSFSPNGTHVASGSKDSTIRIWDSKNKSGSPVIGPFIGHSDMVHSVAFSPDGMSLVSGSKDRTVRVWRVLDGALIAGPFYGHSQWVTSVAFSSDGVHIVSGSNDHSARMWNIHNALHPTPASNTVTTNVSRSPVDNRPANTNFDNWTVSPDGWIIKDGHLLFWVPLEVLRSLLTPHCTFIISRSGSIEINFTRALLGDRWLLLAVSPSMFLIINPNQNQVSTYVLDYVILPKDESPETH
ncbi:hypothetical protein CTheo_6570 [Ceratobasidium theobromae]|uniref:NACHT domain-containing protein n=1 Tax=Ceratobasidium theobromae TaxID=1582974 RepID=A0A5N5QEP5_9AGAM|nr:hypothetical protein CTheo_6570 [Ceratobasidium theobromae]